jgi:DNA-directed RNA polymerase specialized sigma24 family protein
MAAAAEELLASGFLEGLVARLRFSYKSVGDHAADAVAHAVEELMISTKVKNPRRWVTAVAWNRMKMIGVQQARLKSLDELAEYDPDQAIFRDDAGTAEEQALRDVVYGEVVAHVNTWPTDNVRVVTLLYLEAAHKGEPLTSEDAAEIASQILGEEVSDHFVRTWKSRGLARLRTWVPDRFLETAADEGDET